MKGNFEINLDNKQTMKKFKIRIIKNKQNGNFFNFV